IHQLDCTILFFLGGSPMPAHSRQPLVQTPSSGTGLGLRTRLRSRRAGGRSRRPAGLGKPFQPKMDVLEERNPPGSLLSVLALVTSPGLLARAGATDSALILPVGNADWMLPALTSSQDRPTLPTELTEEGPRADEGYLGDARPSFAETSPNAPSPP